MLRQERVCKSCGHTWYPIEPWRPDRCPKCGSTDTKPNCIHQLAVFVDDGIEWINEDVELREKESDE